MKFRVLVEAAVSSEALKGPLTLFCNFLQITFKSWAGTSLTDRYISIKLYISETLVTKSGKPYLTFLSLAVM